MARIRFPCRLGLLLAVSLWLQPATFAQTPKPANADALAPIRSYISDGWNKLSRSLTDCTTYEDSKLNSAPQLYLPPDFPVPENIRALETRCGLHVTNLPAGASRIGQPGVENLKPAGLLYLANPYVVPGGRFNEMYGWDSYFIILGLLRDGRRDLALDMVNNFLFEVEHYGAVLNANRSYYLTRSQPPFLTSMILAVYDSPGGAREKDRSWLANAYQLAVKDHDFWTVEPHLAGTTGLSRYYDFGDGPAAESLQDETGHYRDVAAYFLAHPEAGQELVHTAAGGVALSPDFYKGDRSMRESGFDITFLFGPYGARTHHFAPVGLNSLLFKTEKDLQRMSELLGRTKESAEWAQRAEERKANIQKYLWDAQRGLFFDYDFEKQKRSGYEFVTTFYPLWAGVATPEQAAAVVNHLSQFERQGGLVTSTYRTGAQWDYPYAWAPCQLLADEGLRRYGFQRQADRLSYEFLSMVAENFRRDGTIREKYNAVTRSSETQVSAGYHENVVGFGWTNGVFLELLSKLSPELLRKLAGN
jgi:alpha,alpha-trehalase